MNKIIGSGKEVVKVSQLGEYKKRKVVTEEGVETLALSKTRSTGTVSEKKRKVETEIKEVEKKDTLDLNEVENFDLGEINIEGLENLAKSFFGEEDTTTPVNINEEKAEETEEEVPVLLDLGGVVFFSEATTEVVENKSARELELEAEVAQLKEKKNFLEEKYDNLFNAYKKVGAEHFQLFNLVWQMFAAENELMLTKNKYTYTCTKKPGPGTQASLSQLNASIHVHQSNYEHLKYGAFTLVNTKMEMVQQAQKGSQGTDHSRKDPKKS